MSFIINCITFLIIIGIIPILLIEFNIRDPNEPFLPKITISLILIGFVIWYFSNEDSNDNENDYYNVGQYQYEDNIFYNPKDYYSQKNKNNYNRHYCYQTDMNTYNKITKENTKREIEKLYETKEFQHMYKQKGEDKKNWNWQSRERMERSCYCF